MKRNTVIAAAVAAALSLGAPVAAQASGDHVCKLTHQNLQTTTFLYAHKMTTCAQANRVVAGWWGTTNNDLGPRGWDLHFKVNGGGWKCRFTDRIARYWVCQRAQDRTTSAAGYGVGFSVRSWGQ
jgi:hypothetical protein